MSLTRRSLLGVAAAATFLAGCRPRSRSLAPPTADQTALDAAVAAERALIDAYDTAIAQLDAVAAGALTRSRDRHAAHLRALTAQLPPRPSAPAPATTAPPTAAPGGTVATASGLRRALSGSVPVLQSAAVGVRSGTVAGLLASVAAAHAADAATSAGTS